MYECSRCGSGFPPGAGACPVCAEQDLRAGQTLEGTQPYSAADDDDDDDDDDFVSVVEFEGVLAADHARADPEPRAPLPRPTASQEEYVDPPLPPGAVEFDVAPPGALAVNSEEEAQRWYRLLDESPIFADADADEMATSISQLRPVGGDDQRNTRLEIDIEPRFEYASAPSSADSVIHMMLTLSPRGESIVDLRHGAVGHLILALDLSASMNHPDKYPKLTYALEQMIAKLQAPGSAEVLISIVLFAYGSATLVKAQPASTIDARQLIATLDRHELLFGRYTDVVGAIGRAGRIAYDSHVSDRAMPVRIVLLTDGKPQDMPGAKAKVDLIRKLPVDLDAIAFGLDADVPGLTELVAGHRGGTVKHIRSENLEETFGRMAEVAQRVVSKRTLLDFELQSGVVGGSAYRYRPGRHAFGRGAFKAGRFFHADLGTLESGRKYSLLFQIRLPRTMQSETEIGLITLQIPGFGGPRIFECQLSIPRHAGKDYPTPEQAVIEAREILEALDHDSPEAKLKALKVRRRIYQEERRDPYVIEVLDKAIAQLESRGSMEDLTRAERAALMAHTRTVVFK